jgi:ribosomal protein L21
MQVFEIMGTVDEKGQLLLDEPLEINKASRVKVILLISEENDVNLTEPTVEEIKTSLKTALKEVKQGKTRPISELWTRIDD